MIDQIKQVYILLYRTLIGLIVTVIPIPLAMINPYFGLLTIISIPLGAVLMHNQCKKIIQ